MCECAVELTEGVCAGDRREDRSAEGARSRSVRAMGAQWAAQVVQNRLVNVILVYGVCTGLTGTPI